MDIISLLVVETLFVVVRRFDIGVNRFKLNGLFDMEMNVLMNVGDDLWMLCGIFVVYFLEY